MARRPGRGAALKAARRPGRGAPSGSDGHFPVRFRALEAPRLRDSNLDDTGRRTRRRDELSPLDKRVIEHLQQDGRRPFTQIASDLGVSEAAVRARTNRLVERGILQIVGVADPDKLGFQQALIGIRCEPGRLLDVAEALASMPEVDYVVVTAGRFDVLIETVAEDNEGLLRFLADRLQRVDGVRDTETFSYLRLVKQTYQFGTR
ncbi:MAG TPA: Lrp/AsnC family transcriptional regulator [Candidatus Limnocylindrales bacterium]|nr:Lrp/AsnC family transcriptional regulator [Candidatus Limnocylindrales bacterium]